MHQVTVRFQVEAKDQQEADAEMERLLTKLKEEGALPYPFVVNQMWQPEGVHLDSDGRLLAEWPETDGLNTIRVKDEHGNTVETVEREGDDPLEAVRWKELRDLMPDDALYFQPDEAGDPDGKTSAQTIRSYDVYRHYETAVAAHPDCEILAFTGAEIEEPHFRDEPEPKLMWN